MDYMIEVKNRDTPVDCSEFYIPGSNKMFPTFVSRCQGIFGIKPFARGLYKSNVYYFFRCFTVKTNGYHRSLWTIDLTKEAENETSTVYYEPDQLCQLQVIIWLSMEILTKDIYPLWDWVAMWWPMHHSSHNRAAYEDCACIYEYERLI